MAASQGEDISDEEIIIEKPKSISKPVTTAKPSLVTAQYGVKSPATEEPKVEKAKATRTKKTKPASVPVLEAEEDTPDNNLDKE